MFHRSLPGLALLLLLSVALAQSATPAAATPLPRAERYISGTLTVPAGVNLLHIFVAACSEADPMCMQDIVRVVPLTSEDWVARAGGEKLRYLLPDLPAGQYSLWALNDLNGNLMHDMDTEEMGALLTPDQNPILVKLGTTTADFALYPLK
jgi:hypothetical protein